MSTQVHDTNLVTGAGHWWLRCVRPGRVIVSAEFGLVCYKVNMKIRSDRSEQLGYLLVLVHK